MNRLLLVGMLLITPIASRADEGSELRRAKYHGADAKVMLRCIDQDGHAVSNAYVSSGFTPDGSFERAVACNGMTDEHGIYSVAGKSNGELMFAITKAGYYRTQAHEFLYKRPDVFVSNGRWQPYGMTNTVVLKRKVNPVVMHVKWNSPKNIFPSQGVFYGYDMEAGDWVKPFGKGIVADFHARHERRIGARPLDITTSLTLLFTNAMDGAYCMKADTSGSTMKTVMRADTNALYQKEFVFTYERTPGKARKNTYPTVDDYFVLRTRTEVNERGAIKRAHYAKIVGKCEVAKSDRFDFFYYFNPNANDPNLEADTTKNLLNPGDLGFAP